MAVDSRAVKTGLPVNNLSLADVDALIDMIKRRGTYHAIDRAYKYGLSRPEMREFIADNCPEPEPVTA